MTFTVNSACIGSGTESYAIFVSQDAGGSDPLSYRLHAVAAGLQGCADQRGGIVAEVRLPLMGINAPATIFARLRFADALRTRRM